MIELSNIIKRYAMGEEIINALDNVSVTIQEKEFVSIVGPSGSGKSTLMNIVGCLDTADEGTYTLFGTDVTHLSDNQLSDIRNNKIGFIFQGFNLLSKLNALENVELPLIYQGINANERKDRAIEALKKVGLGERIKHKPTELSGGQQQRVAIARALVTNPSLILADEPTGNLDSKSGREIMALLHELNDNGNTILLITHDSTIAKEAQRSIEIMDGKIIKENIYRAGDAT